MSFLRRLTSWLPISTLDRYIVRNLLVSTLMAVGVLSVVVVLGNVFRSLLDLLVAQAIPFSKLMSLLWDMFAFSLSFTIPWGILTSVLLLFGRLSADNELTSMRMAGLSLWRICLPVFLVAGILSFFCYQINVSFAPDAYRRLKAQRFTMALNNPLAMFEPGRIVDQIPGYRLFCSDKQGNRLINFQLMMLDAREPPNPTNFVMAEEAQIIPKPEEKRLEVVLRQATSVPHQFGTFQEGARQGTRLEVNAPSTSRVFYTDIELKKFWDNAHKPRVDGMSMEELRWVYSHPEPDPPRRGSPLEPVTLEVMAGMAPKDRVILRSEALTEYNSRYSFSLAGLALTLVGICFGITAQRRETSAGFILSLIVGLAYYAFIMLGALLKGRPEYHPELWVWAPNVIFGALGTYLFWRHQRR